MNLGLLVLVGGLAAGLVFIYASSHWRQALFAVLILVIFEGALRKWVFPQARDLLYFLKDAFLIPVYLGMLLGQLRGYPIKLPEILKLLLALNIIWGIIQVFNPMLGSPLVGLLGFRSYFFYIPLMWLLPSLFPDQVALVRFLRLYLLLAIPLGILGIIQYFSPVSSPINQYVASEDVSHIATVGTQARITGTFSYIAGYSTYLTVTFVLLLPFLLHPQPRIWTWLTRLELVFIIVNSLMNGSRGVLFTQVLVLVGYLGIYFMQHPAATLKFITRLVLPGLMLSGSLLFVARPAVDNFMLRVTTNNDIEGRIVLSWTQPPTLIRYTELSGFGIGATSPASQTLAKRLGAPLDLPPIYVEPEMGRVMLEMGPVGYLLWYTLRLYLIGLHWLTFRRLKSPFLRGLSLAALALLIVQFDANLLYNPTQMLYYWVLNSFIFLLPRLDRAGVEEQIIALGAPRVTPVHLPRPSHRQPQLASRRLGLS